MSGARSSVTRTLSHQWHQELEGAPNLGVSVRFSVLALQLVNYMNLYKSLTSLPSVSALAFVLHLVSHLLRSF